MTYFANGEVDFSHLNGSDYQGLQDGRYLVSLRNMELVVSKNGKPMIASQFKVEAGECTGRVEFVNLILLNNGGDEHDGFFVHNCNQFLRGFGLFTDQIKLTTLNAYAQLVDTIANNVKSAGYTYALEVKTEVVNGKKYKRYNIVEGPFNGQQQPQAMQPQAPQYQSFQQTPMQQPMTPQQQSALQVATQATGLPASNFEVGISPVKKDEDVPF